MPKSLKYREFRKILLDHDPRIEEHTRRGKGSHRLFFHPDVDGEPRSYPVKCHGEGKPVGKYAVRDIIRRFNLPEDLFD